MCEGWEFFPLDKLPEPILFGHAAAIQELFLAKKNPGLISI